MSTAKPLQIYIDEEDLKRLDAWTRKHGWTKSQAVRAAVRALVRSEEKDPLLAASGMVDGLPEDCSEAFDRYLTETFVAKKAAPYAQKSSRRKRPRIHR